MPLRGSKAGTRNWSLIHCRALAQVPRSSKLVSEDSDLALFSVTLFKRVADGFKAAARAKGFQVRL